LTGANGKRSITDASVFAGASVQDIKPGGKYFDTFADMLAGMKKGTETESREEACTTANKNYGEASGEVTSASGQLTF
jgi:hypothetical protein